jgi:hypothetical protein
MPVQVIKYQTAREFLDAHERHLYADEVLNHLMLGVLQAATSTPEEANSVFLAVEPNSPSRLLLIQTQEDNAIIQSNGQSPIAINKLIQYLKDDNIQLQGVIGE